MFYTYVHIRPDDEAVFYVGKGSKKRAYSSSDRNPHWHNVVNKNNGNFKVVILNWFNNEEDALNAEIWQISELKKLGNLVNILPGGDSPPVLDGDKNPMRNPEIAKKSGLTRRGTKRNSEVKAKISQSRKGKATGDSNAMRKPEQNGIFEGLNNSMSKYEHREKHYSENKTRGENNGMFGRTGDKNPMFGKPSAMRGKKNLGIAWAAQCKTWQHYWGA